MKTKLLPLLLAVLMLLSACSGEPAASTAASTAAPETRAESTAPQETEAPAFQPVTLLDTESCAFTVTDITVDDVWGYTFQVRCENRTEHSLFFQIPTASCRGWLLTADCSLIVGAGETADSDFNIWPSDLARCEMETLDELRFRLSVTDPDNYSAGPVAETDCVLYPTGLTEQELGPSPVHREWEHEAVCADTEDFLFAVCGQDADNIWTYNLTLYIENKSQQDLTFSWKDVEVNGQEADPWFYYTVPAGLKACFNLYFNEDEMKAKEIESLDFVGFTLVVTPADSFQELYREVFGYTVE